MVAWLSKITPRLRAVDEGSFDETSIVRSGRGSAFENLEVMWRTSVFEELVTSMFDEFQCITPEMHSSSLATDDNLSDGLKITYN
jgi:hypothetical protein